MFPLYQTFHLLEDIPALITTRYLTDMKTRVVSYDGLLELTGKLNQVTKLVNKRYHEGSNLVSKVQFFTIYRIKIIKHSNKSTKNRKK